MRGDRQRWWPIALNLLHSVRRSSLIWEYHGGNVAARETLHIMMIAELSNLTHDLVTFRGIFFNELLGIWIALVIIHFFWKALICTCGVLNSSLKILVYFLLLRSHLFQKPQWVFTQLYLIVFTLVAGLLAWRFNKWSLRVKVTFQHSNKFQFMQLY